VTIEDLKIGIDELIELIMAGVGLVMSINKQTPSTPELIANYLNRYDLILENPLLAEAVPIFHELFNFKNEEEHEKNRIYLRQTLMTYFTQSDKEKLERFNVIEKNNSLFVAETKLYSPEFTEFGYSGLYLDCNWSDAEQQNKANLMLFEKLSKFDQKRGITKEELLFTICNYGAFQLIRVNIFMFN